MDMLNAAQAGWILQNSDDATAMATALLKTNDELTKQLIETFGILQQFGQKLLDGTPLTDDERAGVAFVMRALPDKIAAFSAERARVPEKLADLNVTAARINDTRRKLRTVSV